jgi:O-antigen/teichoic acid export membrane protein
MMNIFLHEKLFLLLQYLRDPLFRNSFFISLSRFSDIGLGFVFWLVAAHYYSISDVGETAAILSSIGLVILLSRFGFDASQIRFMADYEKEAVFNTSLWIPAIASVIIGGIYFAFIRYSTPASSFIHGYFFIFVILAFLNSITMTISNAFISFQKAEYRFIQNLVLGIRIPMIVLLASFGSIGIFLSYGIAYLITAIFAVWLILKFVPITLEVDKKFIQETSRFNKYGYFSTLFYSGPLLIMPLLILSVSGSENAALYYIAFAFGNIVMIIPEAISTSFFVEGSLGGPIKKGVFKSFFITVLILIPAVIFIWIFGENVLQWLGKDYSGAIYLLRIYILSSFLVGVYNLFSILEAIRLNIEIGIKMNALRAILLIVLSYTLLIYQGIAGIAWAWFLTHAILCGIVLWIFRKNIFNEFEKYRNMIKNDTDI